ncbi:MAG: hypothetical protein ACI8Z1_003867 [Candidatus Azotimanducaceae bacterium]|jgi:hypothetical protein
MKNSEPNQVPAPVQADNEQDAPKFWEIVVSVLAAAFGVQNSKNRERDFTRGNPLVFIAAGLIFTVLFVLTLVGIVNLVL